MKLLQVEGTRAPVPHSWRRHWQWFFTALHKPIVYLISVFVVFVSITSQIV